MHHRTLICTEALAAELADPLLAIVDCSFRLDDTGWGRSEHTKSHIPGAVYAHLDEDLSGAKTGGNGRHPLPSPGVLAETFGRMGIDSTTQVVAYDQDTGAWASRLWWMLRWLGHDAVAVLDGGFARWTAEGRPTGSGIESRRARTFVPRPREMMIAEAGQVAATLDTAAWRLIDARTPERYRGEVEPIDRRAGHIPGAVNHPYRDNLDEHGVFLPVEDLRRRLQAATGGTAPERVICYCGSGVTACHNLLAMEHAGLSGAKLYPGSWSEWSSDPARPIA
jgi:thiosulfate/3-mercaptopyruvate sulfurtransferase